MSSDMETLRNRLQNALLLIKEAVDISVKIRLENPNSWKEVSGLWDPVLGEIWHYIKVQSTRSGQNLLRGISIFRFR